MKTRTALLSFLILILSGRAGFAQTADDYVQVGRGFLLQQDAFHAQAQFQAALAMNPNHPDANALLAGTRLLSLANTPEGTALLDRLGFDVLGRNPYDWRSRIPADANGITLAATNFSASQLSAFIRTNVLPALQMSGTNLSRITDTNYTLTLSQPETSASQVTLDFGDLQMLRAGLRAAEYLSYTIYSWNVDIQLTAIRDYATNENATFEQFLASNPFLFTFATTNDLQFAKVAVVQAAERYFAASTFIRARPNSIVRLFNYDLGMAEDEKNFRDDLAAVTNSLSGPVPLPTPTNLTVHLANHFNGQTPPRALLPDFFGDDFLLGSLPDPTFGGVIQGVSQGFLEAALAHRVGVVVPLSGSLSPSPKRFNLDFPTLPDRSYVVQVSTNFSSWTELLEFTATNDVYHYSDTNLSGPKKFYRLLDVSWGFSVDGQIIDGCSGLPLSGATVGSSLSSRTALTDANGRYFLQTRIAPGPFNLTVMAQRSGYGIATNLIWAGAGDFEGLDLALPPSSSSPPPNNAFANRVVLPGATPSASGSTCGANREATEPAGGEASVWYSWTSPFSGDVFLEMNYFEYPLVDIYVGANLATLTNIFDGYGYASFTAAAGTTYQIRISGVSGTRGSFNFQLSNWPTLTLDAPLDGDVFTAPANISVAATFMSAASTLKQAELRVNGKVIATTTTMPINFVWTNVPPGIYDLHVVAEDQLGQPESGSATVYVTPANDDFANRIPLVGSNVRVFGDNQNATHEDDEPDHDSAGGTSSVWWTWTASAGGNVTIIANGDRDNAGILAVYTGNTLPTLSAVASNSYAFEFGAQVTFAVTPGTTYQIAVDGYEGGALQLRLVTAVPPVITITSPTNGQAILIGQPIGLQATATDADGTVQNVSFFSEQHGTLGSDTTAPYTFTLVNPTVGFYYVIASAVDSQGLISYSDGTDFEVVPPPPPNDNFSNRITLAGSSISFLATNWGATSEVGEPAHAGSPAGNTLWWKWTAPSNGVVTISTYGSDFDTVLAVYTGSGLNTLIEIASNDQNAEDSTSEVSFPVTAGTTYQIAVDGYLGSLGEIHFLLNAAAVLSLKDALDGHGLVWTTGGSAAWTGQFTTTSDGIDAAQSGTITHNQESWIETTVTGPGEIDFGWSVSSESGFDLLRFNIDGVQQASISASPAWQFPFFNIGSGPHTLRWRYTKNGSISSGSDRAWLDYVIFYPQ